MEFFEKSSLIFQGEEAWLSDNVVGTALDGTSALAAFTTYLQGLITNTDIKAYDHAVGLTRYRAIECIEAWN